VEDGGGEGLQAIKIKCSDSALYRIEPVFDYIDDGQSLEIEVKRAPGGAAKTDKLVVVHIPVSLEARKEEESGARGRARRHRRALQEGGQGAEVRPRPPQHCPLNNNTRTIPVLSRLHTTAHHTRSEHWG